MPRWTADLPGRDGCSDVSFQYRNGEEADLYTILESLGGGVALIDYDGDGCSICFSPAAAISTRDKTVKGHPFVFTK